MLQKWMLIFLLITALSGCSLMSPVNVAPVNKYVLHPITSCATKKSRTEITLLVVQPEANELYNTTLIAYSLCPYHIGYYALNQWAATPAQMLQPLMVQALQNTHYFKAVSSSGSYGQYDYILNSQLLELIHVFRCNCTSYVRLVLRVQLISVGDNKIIATKEFCLTEPSPCPAPYGAVVAANRATARMLEQLAVFGLRAEEP